MSETGRLVFAGTPAFAARHLEALLQAGQPVAAVLTQPDRPSGRGKRLSASPVKQLAQAAGLPVLQPVSLKAPEDQGALRVLQPDLMVVVAYGLILPQAVLDIPRLGCLNVHASLLPRWRGAAPIQRAVEAGDTKSGVTIMQMEAGLDTGPMVEHAAIPLSMQETGGSLHDRLATVGAELLVDVIKDLPGKLTGATPQDPSQATYAGKILKHEGDLNWCKPADTLARRVRAFNPSPGCFSHVAGERLKIWQATPCDVPPHAPPGEILNANASGVVVACGTGGLRIDAARLPGGKALPVAELLRGKGHDLLARGQFFTVTPP